MAPEAIRFGIEQIEAALGDYLCTDSQPCAAAVYYDEGELKPWRIADDHTSERFAILEDAIAGAEAWAESMASRNVAYENPE